MTSRTHCFAAFFCVTFVHLLFLFFAPMFGCGFRPGTAPDPVDDTMDHPNSYDCGCRCGAAVTQSISIAAAADDSEQAGADPLDLDGSADLDFGVRPVGLRFVGIDIPPGAVVMSAHLQVSADQEFGGSNTGLANLQIIGEAADDAAPFGGNFADLTARTPTGASVPWSALPWAVLDRGPAQLSPDLTPVIQEIVGRPGWQLGNALALIILGAGRREAESFDGNPANIAVLEIEFSVGVEFALDVCMPESLNPNLGDPQNPIPSDAALQADCEGRVQTALSNLASSCSYPGQCDCDFAAGSQLFNATCNEPGVEVPLDPDCTNFDPVNGTATATNAPGDAPVFVAARTAGGSGPSPLAAGAFGMTSECEVEGPVVVDIGDEHKTTEARGTVEFLGETCPGAQCSLGVTYSLMLDPITFQVRFAADPTFEDLAATGASSAGAALIGPAGLGLIDAEVTESSIRGRRSSDTKAFVLTNPDPVGIFVNWDQHLCGLFGNVAGTVDDEGEQELGAEVSAQGMILNTPPRADAGADAVVECTSPQGAVVSLDGRGSSDLEGNFVLFSWFLGSRVGEGAGFGRTLALQQALGGSSLYVLRVIDGFGQADEDAATIGVVDTTAPDISLSASPTQLWPPDHQLVPVTVSLNASDVCDATPAIRLVSIMSNEGDLANGSGQTSPDIQDAMFGTDDRAFLLRAERSGKGNGRVYTIVYEVADASGNVSMRSVMVTVPKSQGGGP